jgi:hypothetical protein
MWQESAIALGVAIVIEMLRDDNTSVMGSGQNLRHNFISSFFNSSQERHRRR